MALSTTPPKGTQDRMPQEFMIRQYIFQTRRHVCQSFGYEEYLTPLVESADVYRAKSGEDVGGTELTLINDRGGRDIAIRPEMTPSVTRMVARNYTQLPKPIKYFSIANFYRNERPQRGRNREFWQLNVDLFGVESVTADVEILQMAVEIMLAFDTPKQSWELRLNHRGLIDHVLDTELELTDNKTNVVRLMDKYKKLPQEKFVAALQELGLDDKQIAILVNYMQCQTLSDLVQLFPSVAKIAAYEDILFLQETLHTLGYAKHIQFSTNLIRGFDYYDGMVFEVFDLHPDNNRAMFGGGRYNGLADIFGVEAFPAVGFAPGDEPMRNFLESRGKIDDIVDAVQTDVYYIPLLDDTLFADIAQIAAHLRKEKKAVEVGLQSQKIGKALQYADKKGYSHVILFGEKEKNKNQYIVKTLTSGEETSVSID